MKNIRRFWGSLVQFSRWFWKNHVLPRYDRRRWYREVYLKSDHWNDFRKKAIVFYGGVCQEKNCRFEWPLDVHHKHYKTIGREKFRDVTPLCRYHHTLIEEGYSIPLKNSGWLEGYKKQVYKYQK